MYEVIILSSDDKKDCPFFRFFNWPEAVDMIELSLKQGYSCEVNYVENFTNRGEI